MSWESEMKGCVPFAIATTLAAMITSLDAGTAACRPNTALIMADDLGYGIEEVGDR